MNHRVCPGCGRGPLPADRNECKKFPHCRKEFKLTKKTDKNSGQYFAAIGRAKHLLEQARRELDNACQIKQMWDVELTGRQIGTLIFFLESKARL